MDETHRPNGVSPLLEATLRCIAEAAPSPRAGVVEAFASAYLRRLPTDAAIDPEEMCRQVLDLFRFVDERSEPAAVRVLNPTPATHGYSAKGTVVEVNVEDLPFLVDSVSNEIMAYGLEVEQVLHPVLGTERDAAGRLVAVHHARAAGHRESVQHYELNRRLFSADLPALEQAVRSVLEDVRRVVRDFRPMTEWIDRLVEHLRAAAGHYPEEDVSEGIAFLEWLRQDNFVFLGCREYRVVETELGSAVQMVPETGLGVLSAEERSGLREPRLLREMPEDVAARYREGDLLVITKTNRRATVHRRGRMDYVGIRIVDGAGVTVGEDRLLGLFTSKAYMEPNAQTPILRRKLSTIVAAEDLIEGSHDYKAVVQLFDGFSKDDLFAASAEDLRRELVGLLSLHEHHQVRLFVRRDLLQRNVSILVALPRDRFNADLRRRLQNLFMRRYGGTSVDYHLSLGEVDPAHVQFTVWVEQGAIPEVDFRSLEAEIIALTRSWGERVAEALVARLGRERGEELAGSWSGRFPDYYSTSTEPEQAAEDVERLESLVHAELPFIVGLRNRSQAGEELTRVVLYRRDGKRPLTELVPALEDLGLEVVEEVPTRLAGRGRYFIHDFGVVDVEGRPLRTEECGDRVAAALTAVWSGGAESDSLHRLVVSAGLTHRQVAVLRAYRTYWLRVAPVFTIAYINAGLTSYPQIAADLVRFFEARFDPGREDRGEAELRGRILAALDAVPSLDVDRILRTLLRLIEATVRTSVFRPERRSMAFKLRSGEVPDLPRPHPMAEIFVIGPSVEGIHLRAGPVARGGIRWSDRRQDYRTEVLGLMTAQVAKNALIVPTGAKGGFVLRRPPADPSLVREEVRDQYEVFIRGLLDVTDNLVDNAVVHPDGVRVLDGDDPYLVVAADKGTATFSDLANAIAAEYGFWLDDAFASGGSAGYDHKVLGITARGAWTSLERHFREMGIDPGDEHFTAVGIGDMSGDVFGNGMLLSDRLKLVAAFDHRHVFLDPDPDPAAAFAERRRLFELPTSSWADYDPAVISEGGGVFPRTAKRVDVSAAAARLLGIPEGEMTPAELVKAVLLASVDVLWNGGIGTFVKASTETHEEVGDRANDAVRVDGRDLRARVIVEGGNLGLTQRGRIEYARAGGHINTDFIDNSAGVDCSDREVNLKILLGLAERSGELSRKARDSLIAEVADDVVERILYDNFHQVQMISLEEATSPRRLEAYEQLMEALESDGILDRDIHGLPSADEMAERMRSGVGLTRPELAALLVDAKRILYESVVASDLPDDPYLLDDVRRYFPHQATTRFGHHIEHHPLRRELVATLLANDLVNSEGITFVTRLTGQTGAEAADVVRAFRAARDVAGAVARWEAIEDLFGSVDLETWTELMATTADVVGVLTRWYLAHPTAAVLGAGTARQEEAFRRIEKSLPSAGAPEWCRERVEEAQTLVERGVPEALARRHVHFPSLVHAPDIIELAADSGLPVEAVAEVFFRAGQALRLDVLEELAERVPGSGSWQRWAVQTLEDDLMAVRRDLAAEVLAGADGRTAEAAVDRFVAERSHDVARLVRFMRSLEASPPGDLAPVLVAIRQVRAALG